MDSRISYRCKHWDDTNKYRDIIGIKGMNILDWYLCVECGIKLSVYFDDDYYHNLYYETLKKSFPAFTPFIIDFYDKYSNDLISIDSPSAIPLWIEFRDEYLRKQKLQKIRSKINGKD